MMDQSPKGMIVTVAGNGEPGHSGDGNLAITACLNEPKNLCFDGEGNLFIADSENHAIRREFYLSKTMYFWALEFGFR